MTFIIKYREEKNGKIKIWTGDADASEEVVTLFQSFVQKYYEIVSIVPQHD